MIYASRTAESLNRTYNSEPVTLHDHDWADGFCQHPDCDTFVPTHEANPILVEFREYDDRNRKVFLTWHDTMSEWIWDRFGFMPTLDQIDHAERVLSRLAQFTKED